MTNKYKTKKTTKKKKKMNKKKEMKIMLLNKSIYVYKPVEDEQHHKEVLTGRILLSIRQRSVKVYDTPADTRSVTHRGVWEK